MEDYTHGLLEGQRHSGICKKKSVIQCRVCHVVLRSIHSSARNGLGIAPPSIALRPSSRPDNPPRLDWYWGISVLRPARLERILIVAQICLEYLIILGILSISILRPARLERVLIVAQIGLEYLIILDILRYIILKPARLERVLIAAQIGLEYLIIFDISWSQLVPNVSQTGLEYVVTITPRKILRPARLERVLIVTQVLNTW